MMWLHVEGKFPDESAAPEHVIIEAEDFDAACHRFNELYDEDPCRAEKIWGSDPRYGVEASMKYRMDECDTYKEALTAAFGKKTAAMVGKPRTVFKPHYVDVSALEVHISDEV